MNKTKTELKTIVLNDDEISTELASINIPDIVVPAWGKPLLERRMRCRLLECRPGGTIAIHSHENRPALLYVLQGAGKNIPIKRTHRCSGKKVTAMQNSMMSSIG